MKLSKRCIAEMEEFLRWPWRINLANTRMAEDAESPVLDFLKRRLVYATRSVRRLARTSETPDIDIFTSKAYKRLVQEGQREVDLIRGRLWTAQNPRPRLLVMRSSDGELSPIAAEFKDTFDVSKLKNNELWCIGSDGKPWAWTQHEPTNNEEQLFADTLDLGCEEIRTRTLTKTIKGQKKAVECGTKVIAGAQKAAAATNALRKAKGTSVQAILPQLQLAHDTLVAKGLSHRRACELVAQRHRGGKGAEYLRKILKRTPEK